MALQRFSLCLDKPGWANLTFMHGLCWMSSAFFDTLHCACAGFLQAWLGFGLRDQVVQRVRELLQQLAPDQHCTIMLTGKQPASCDPAV